ncbi:RNA polymerase sigma factor [Paraburkholderia tropica]|uniref:hypothetical protein n=1 Tax=Paraburkholderia tropica TaxID=92647 RepID=UPI002AB0EFA4|nr:hypothetical protein [Paraburkholderia tropica]
MSAHATTQQIIDAFRDLTPRQRKSLLFAGDRLSESMGSDGGCDLLQEALLRMLDGRRKWPLHIRFDFYVFRVMDSIAHGERKRQRHALWLRSPFDDHCDEAGGWQSPAPTPEQAAIAAEGIRLASRAAKRARLMLMSDLDRAVMDAVLEGEVRSQTCSRLGLAPRDYDLARQRVMGRLRAVGLAEGICAPKQAKQRAKETGVDSSNTAPGPSASMPQPASRKSPRQSQ